MIPRNETNEASGSSYGRYEGNQVYADQQTTSSSEQSQSAETSAKIYPLPPDRKNLFRFLLVLFAMVIILVLAFICLLAVGGTGGWISFISVSFIVFLMIAVALDKFQ